MRNHRYLAPFGALVLLLGCSIAFGQASPAPKPAGEDWLRLLDTIPGDCVMFVVVKDVRGFADRANGFIKGILPKSLVGEFDSLELFLRDTDLGETFNKHGSWAVAVMDPTNHARRLARKLKADEDDQREQMIDLESKHLPTLFFLPGKDPAKMFPGRKVEKDGELTKLTRKDDEVWCIERNGFVVCSFNKSAMKAIPSRITALVGLTGADEKLATTSDVLLWVDRARAAKLEGTVFERLFWRSFSGPGLEDFGPVAAPIKWMHLTREELFRQSEHMLLGVRLNDDGWFGQLRVHYAPTSVVGKALLAARCTDAPLTVHVPEGPFIFAYGARKDIFQTPPEVKKTQMEAMKKDPAMQDVPEKIRDQLARMIPAINEQVTGVEHWAGQCREAGPMAIANVVHCKDAAKLLQIARENLKVFEALVNLSLDMTDDDEDERFKLTYKKAAGTLDQIKYDMIDATHAVMEEALKDEDMGLLHIKTLMKQAFPGELKFRVRLAVVDKNTLVITLGGGKRFLRDAVAAAKAAKTKLEQSELVAESLAKLPPKRFAVAIVDVTQAIGFGIRCFMSATGMQGMQVTVKPAPPVVVGLSAEKSDMVINVYLPTKMFKRAAASIPMLGGGVPDDVEDEEDEEEE